MGAFTSRRDEGVEEVDISNSNAYRYPPKSGCYFGSHFILGGERFETTQPENYLFGDNADLNFLGNRPIPFSYPPPQAHEPTKTLKSLVNIRKDSLKLIKVIDESCVHKNTDSNDEMYDFKTMYNLEFTFDSDVRVAITVYFFATEEISQGHAIYHPRDPATNSETFHYKRGASQVFNQSSFLIDPDVFTETDLSNDRDVTPVVIQCTVEDSAEFVGHSHMTFATFEKNSESGFVIKPLKQKQMVDGLCYLLQEIYGIENKNAAKEEEFDDTGSECVICMSNSRDTLILPCRHLCLCNHCADSLRLQANSCPICRVPFRALLQIRAMRKKPSLLLPSHVPQNEVDDSLLSQEGVPSGYEAVALLEALNGSETAHTQPTGCVPRLPPDAFVKVSLSEINASPKLEHKPKRTASLKSNKSQKSVSIEVERANENAREFIDPEVEDLDTLEGATAMVENSRHTPEVLMSEGLGDFDKHDEKRKRAFYPKVCYSEKTPSVLIDEKVQSSNISLEDYLSEDLDADYDDTNTAEPDASKLRERSAVDATLVKIPVTSLKIDEAAHEAVNYEQFESEPAILPTDSLNDTESLTINLEHEQPSNNMDVLILPTSETRMLSSDSSGSSYSSTSSGQALMIHEPNPTDSDSKETIA